MEVKAISRFVKVSPRKVRLVANRIKGLAPQKVIETLKVVQKAAGLPIVKTLKSALYNATNNFKLSSDNLRIKKILVNEGGALKRFHPAARGRAHPYKKRMSHITVILEEIHGTKS